MLSAPSGKNSPHSKRWPGSKETYQFPPMSWAYRGSLDLSEQQPLLPQGYDSKVPCRLLFFRSPVPSLPHLSPLHFAPRVFSGPSLKYQLLFSISSCPDSTLHCHPNSGLVERGELSGGCLKSSWGNGPISFLLFRSCFCFYLFCSLGAASHRGKGQFRAQREQPGSQSTFYLVTFFFFL